MEITRRPEIKAVGTGCASLDNMLPCLIWRMKHMRSDMDEENPLRTSWDRERHMIRKTQNSQLVPAEGFFPSTCAPHFQTATSHLFDESLCGLVTWSTVEETNAQNESNRGSLKQDTHNQQIPGQCVLFGDLMFHEFELSSWGIVLRQNRRFSFKSRSAWTRDFFKTTLLFCGC